MAAIVEKIILNPDGTTFSTVNADAPADRHFLIAPSDTVDLSPIPRAIVCQAAGTITVRDGAGTDLPYTMVVGQIMPFRGVRVLATGASGTYYGWY